MDATCEQQEEQAGSPLAAQAGKPVLRSCVVPLCSIVGVNEVMTLTADALNAEGWRPAKRRRRREPISRRS